jgi:hypothetical protein
VCYLCTLVCVPAFFLNGALPNWGLLDRILVIFKMQKLVCTFCLSYKIDLL